MTREEATMDRRARWIGGGALAVALLGGGTGVAIATGGGDDRPLTGSALEKATAAALQHTGGGTVLETEAGDEEPRTGWRSVSTTDGWSKSASMRTSRSSGRREMTMAPPTRSRTATENRHDQTLPQGGCDGSQAGRRGSRAHAPHRRGAGWDRHRRRHVSAAAPPGERTGDPRSGRLRGGDRQPISAVPPRRQVGVPGDRSPGHLAEGHGDRHDQQEEDPGHRRDGRPR